MQLMELLFGYWESGEDAFANVSTENESDSYSIRSLTFQAWSQYLYADVS